MKRYTFTVDDNIRVFSELTRGEYDSIFDHPYLSVYKRLHERYGVRVQLNLFYEMENFTLSEMTDKYASEWEACSEWLKLSFHSRLENVSPYELSEYSEVHDDAEAVMREILRFAGRRSLADTTTVHYCRTTIDGAGALADLGVRGLLGLYGTPDEPRRSYSIPEDAAERARAGETVWVDGMAHASIDLIINCVGIDGITPALDKLMGRNRVSLMIHEQYFYPDYERYQPDFEEKLALAFSYMNDAGYKSCFFDNIIDM